MEDGTERISLLDSLDGEWLKLPLQIMQVVGPAVQTLGGVLKITTKETFSPVTDIAAAARVPVATVRKHLVTLDEQKWIQNKGRQRTRAGQPRRTCTITLLKKTHDHLEPYGFLPWWACCRIRKVGKLPWCAKAVLSVVMSRLCSLKAAVEREDGHGLDADDIIGSIENLGGDDRFEFSLDDLTAQTGLTRDSVVRAKHWLYHQGIVAWSGREPTKGESTPTDILAANWGFRVVVTPAGDGRCYVAFHSEDV